MNLFDHIRQLYQAELYEDFIHLFSLVLSLSENNEECELLTLAQKYQCFVYCGNACFQLGEYRKAVRAFKKSFLLKKAINKVKGKCGTTQDLTSEVDVKFRVYQCHMKLKETSEALQVLESISTKQRTAKINLALARLYQHDGRDRSALTCYKEVLRLTGLIRCYASMATREHVMAISSLRSLETKPGLRDNIHLQDCLAEALFMAGQYTEAAMAFLRIRALDPFHMKNMDLYAYTLSREKRTKDLQILSQQLMEVNEQAVEPWVCMGYYSLNSINKQNERLVRTVYCAQKAYSINPQCTQALLLKGAALQELNRMQDALLHFHEAVSRAPDRFETYQGIIDCYIASHRLRDAVTLATRAFSHLGCTARTSTLLASVLAKSPTTVAKAKPYLEKALKMDPFYLEAVYIMCDILSQEQDYDRGIALLDPSSIQAREGMERVEKHNEMGLEGSYDVEVEDVPGSDNEPDFDGSDMESTWSDTEFSQP
ncbi:hypothetical protein C0Q70_06743 [Pomacea canaliculata]|uniref:Anaphase-promoting complex subunit 7 n=1 Tax=Pomacea canaliculata TaxID=400727 RepID=A0A2T7PD54_POMCA|nr:hypothetical protein C0Q70_06743 [Pomacea canaliculata]